MLYNFWLSKKCLLWLSFRPLMSTTSFKLQKLVLFKRFLFPFQSLLWAHDEIAEKNFEEDYETQQLDSPPPPVFSSIQDSVRLVGIRKNKNEPLVTIKTFFFVLFHTIYLQLLFLHSISFPTPQLSSHHLLFIFFLFQTYAKDIPVMQTLSVREMGSACS